MADRRDPCHPPSVETIMRLAERGLLTETEARWCLRMKRRSEQTWVERLIAEWIV